MRGCSLAARAATSGRTSRARRNKARIALALGLVAAAGSAGAAELLDANGFKLRWDDTVKYTTVWRLESPSDGLTHDANQDDGDRNFKSGLVSNRFDLLSELDATYGQFGARLSGAAWYDTSYTGSTDNDSPQTFNPLSVTPGHFVDSVRDLQGRKAELLDALAFAKFEFGGVPGVVRFGKHTVVFGETLFFGSNGIAAAQAPVDVIKLLSVPNTQFKELLMPVPQVSTQLQLLSNLSLAGYYQLRWTRTRLPGAGSYFSNNDFLDVGGERVLVGPPLAPVPGFLPAALYRAPDLEGRNSGQGGLAVHWRPTDLDVDFGLYAVRYNDKTPQIYVIPGAGLNPPAGQVGEYQLVFPNAVRAYGASFSTVIADANVAGEISFRRNAPLVSDAAPVPAPGAFDNSGHPAYAVGNTMHLNLSAIYVWEKSYLFDNASFTGEVGWNSVQGVTRNPAILDPNSSKTALAFRLLFEPNYYQILHGLDASVPLGLGYNPSGRSGAVGAFNGGATHGGDLSVGFKGTYLNRYKGSLNYTRYLGPEGTNLKLVNGAYQFSFNQSLKDRDFLSLSFQYTF